MAFSNALGHGDIALILDQHVGIYYVQNSAGWPKATDLLAFLAALSTVWFVVSLPLAALDFNY